ncbi:hypothetical protein ACTFIU_003244 [Dictyostelium citrinum]
MEKKYNTFSKLQQSSIDNMKSYIFFSSKIVIENINLGKINCIRYNENGKVLRILDVGSSHGRNSIIVLNFIISSILKHFPNQCFGVLHNDLPENDFTFYLKLSDQIYFYGIGNSFYNQVVPSNSIDLCFSFATLYWCDHNDKFHYDTDSIAVMYKKRSVEYRKYCIDTLYKFFSIRSKELKDGGSLICSFLCENDSLSPELDSISLILIKMKTVLKQMANENLINIENVNKMVLFWNVYKEDEVKEVLKKLERNKLFKTILMKQNVQTIPNISSLLGESEIEKQINFFYHINTFSEKIIKSHIDGDEKQKESFFQMFLCRFINYLLENPINNTEFILSYYTLILEKSS